MAKGEACLRSRVTVLCSNVEEGKRGSWLGALQVKDSGAVSSLGVALCRRGLVPTLSFGEARRSSTTVPRSALYRLGQAELVLGDPGGQRPTPCSVSESW